MWKNTTSIFLICVLQAFLGLMTAGCRNSRSKAPLEENRTGKQEKRDIKTTGTQEEREIMTKPELVDRLNHLLRECRAYRKEANKLKVKAHSKLSKIKKINGASSGGDLMKRLEEDFKKIEEIDEQLGQKLQECSECVTRNPECFDPLEERTLKIVKNFVSAVNTSIRNYREFEKSEHKRANDSLDLTPKRRNGITKW